MWIAFCSLVSLWQANAQLATSEWERLVDYVAPSLLAADDAAQPRVVLNTNGPAAGWLIAPPRPTTAAERRIQFETEYGIREPEPGAVRAAVQQAKYRLDETIFEATEWLETVEHALEWQYDLYRTRPAQARAERRATSGSANLLRDAWEGATIRTDVDLNLAGRAFVGLRLQVPVGP